MATSSLARLVGVVTRVFRQNICFGSSVFYRSTGLPRPAISPYIIMSSFAHFATKAIHIGSEPDQWKCHAVVPPIFLSTTFEEQEPAVTYVRFVSKIVITSIFVYCQIISFHLC